MYQASKKVIMVVSFAAACTASLAGAALYKWVDEKGITHYGDSVPPEYVNRGSTQLNKSGTAIKKTDPALTPEQRKALVDEQTAKGEEAKRAAEQKRKDQVLLDTYSSEREIEQVKNRNISVVQDVIKGTKNRINELNLRRQQIEKEKVAPNGQPQALSTSRQRELSSLDSELPTLQKTLDQKTQEVETLRTKYDADAKRYREISAQKAQGKSQ